MNSTESAPSRRPKFSAGLWLVFALLTMLGLFVLFPARSGRIVDEWREIDIQTAQIHTALQSYESAFGAFPVGDSPAVFRALRGQNPLQIVFLYCSSGSVSADGSMLDPWGTPYKLYFSGKEVLVRSAGPNKQFDASGKNDFDDYIR